MALPFPRIVFLFGLCAWLGCATSSPPPAYPDLPVLGFEIEAPALPELPEPELPAAAVDPESIARARVVETATSMVGVPYRYGGGGPGGFDCSGLVRYSYELGGFPELPHSSRAQYAGAEKIPIAELQPGDLLFFTFRGRKVSHVAIYVGGDEFVHVAKTSHRVERVRLDHPYWRRQLELAGRVRWPQREAAR